MPAICVTFLHHFLHHPRLLILIEESHHLHHIHIESLGNRSRFRQRNVKKRKHLLEPLHISLHITDNSLVITRERNRHRMQLRIRYHPFYISLWHRSMTDNLSISCYARSTINRHNAIILQSLHIPYERHRTPCGNKHLNAFLTDSMNSTKSRLRNGMCLERNQCSVYIKENRLNFQFSIINYQVS